MQDVKSSVCWQPYICPEMLSQRGQDTGACLWTFQITEEWKQRHEKQEVEFINESWSLWDTEADGSVLDYVLD